MNCLSRDRLLEFISDESRDDSDEIARHLQDCSRCEELLDSLCADSTIEALRQQQLRRTPAPDTSRVAALLEWAAERRPSDVTRLPPTRGWEEGESEEEPSEEESQILPLAEEVGPYRIEQELGRGGMGAVFVALHQLLGRRVALKVIHPRRAADPRMVQRFLREMNALGRLTHPHVVQAFDAGESRGIHYLAMELVDGVNAEQLARRNAPLPIAEACEIVRQGALGLHYAHQQGLLHRDLKPSNLLVSEQGVVKIADLGLVQFRGAPKGGLTGTDVVVGTADYLPPEQAASDRTLDERSDLYSLGCILYRLLGGRPPFSGPRYATSTKKIVGHVKDAPTPIAELRPDVPAPLAALVHRLLEKSPEARPTSAAEVAEALAEHSDKNAERLASLSAIAKANRPAALPVTKTHSAAPVGGGNSRGFGWVSLAAGGGAVVLLIALAALAIAWRPQSPRDLAKPSGAERPVAAGLAGGTPDRAAPMNPLAPTEEPASTPVVSQASMKASPMSVPLVLSEVEPSIWHDMLRVEPHQLYWNRGPGAPPPHFDPRRGEVLFVAHDTGLLQMVQADVKSYRLQIGLRQPVWEGGVGVFFGAHRAVDEAGEHLRYQYLSLSKGLRSMYFIHRGVGKIYSPGSKVRSSGSVFVGDQIPAPGPHEHILEVTINDGRLSRATWNGMELANVVNPPNPPPVGADDFRGPAGLYIAARGGSTGNARAMWFANER